MGTDLVSACIFCAGFLLGIDLPPRPGLAAEIGLSYATLARRYPVPGEPVDDSDVTPKFVLIGMGNAHPAAGSFGAGTPAFEWRVRVAFGPSHDEQVRNASPNRERASANGTGRYENFSLLGRLPIGASDSIEASLDRRGHKATDVINIGGQEHAFSEERTLSAERGDGAIGWRHRFRDAEIGGAARYVKLTGFNATAGAYYRSSGGLWGGSVEGRLRRGRWSVLAHYERLSGSLDVLEESLPDFHVRRPAGEARLEAARLGLGYSWPRTDLWATATYDRSRLPFIALAVLGTETAGFDEGYHPDSRTRQFFGDLTARHAFTPAIRARLTLRLATGDETVILTDSSGVLPTQSLDLQRRGRFGGGLSRSIGWPELTFFLGADFSVGGGR